MNPEDVNIVRAEREASRAEYDTFDPDNSFGARYGPGSEYERRRESQFSNTSSTQRQNSNDPNAAFDRNYGPSTRNSAVDSANRQSANADDEPVEEAEEPAEDEKYDAGRGAPLGRTQTETDRINRLESHPTALERIETHRSLHSGTVGGQHRTYSLRSRKSEGPPLPNFGAGKPYPPMLPSQEEYVVEFDGPNDPLHPQNWSMKKKLGIAAVLAFNSLCATFGSSVFSNAAPVAAKEFGVGQEVATLATSLFVLGYAFGPIIWAPMSELYGRKPPIVIAMFGFGVFSIAVAVAKDIQTIEICRFFSGLFGSCPLAVVAAVFTDMFNNKQRGISVAVFAATVFMGPLMAPFIGGFITISYLGWRWTEYITAIMVFTALILAVFVQEESYPPVILVSKASNLRRRTRNWGIHAKQEEVEVDLFQLLQKNISRPLRILFTEPIVLLVTIYMSFIYGLLYLFLTAYAIVFQQIYGFNAGVGGLPYFGLIVGILIGFTAIVIEQPSYVRKLEANKNIPVPEWRLPIPMFSAAIFAGGLFWFGWTGYQGTLPWIVPTLSGILTGFGIYTIFVQFLNYIVDAYLMFAASAIAGNTFMRSICGAVFPLFASYMYNGIGIEWGNTLLGCLAVAMIPMPVLFYLKGRSIRAKSKMAPALDIKMGPLADKKDEEAAGGSNSSDEGEAKKAE